MYKPVQSGHPWLRPKVAARDRWPLSTGYPIWLKKTLYLRMSELLLILTTNPKIHIIGYSSQFTLNSDSIQSQFK